MTILVILVLKLLLGNKVIIRFSVVLPATSWV